MPPGREQELRIAARTCALTVLWNLLAGGAAIVTAAAVGSLSLTGFGVNAALDSIASASLVWRLRAEERRPDRADRIEGVTVRIVGVTLIAIGLLIPVQAVRSLLTGSSPEASTVPLVIAGLSLAALPPLAVAKLRLARRLDSRALRGDGVLTAVGSILAALTLIAFALDTAFGWRWTDGVTAIVISPIIVREASLMLRAKRPAIPHA